MQNAMREEVFSLIQQPLVKSKQLDITDQFCVNFAQTFNKYLVEQGWLVKIQ